MTRHRVLSTFEVPYGRAVSVEVGDHRLAIAKVDGEFYALDDVCTHDGWPLGYGRLYGDQIECPRHGARFDVRTGRVTRMPAVRPIKTYPVSVEDGSIYVEIEEEEW